jgi:hypothetical protein
MTDVEVLDANVPDNVLDFALAHFGPLTEEDLYASVRSATAGDLERFLDAYSEFAALGTTRAPVLEPGELRPYFPASDMPPWLRGHFSVDNAALTMANGDWKAVEAIKHRLLYCHSVAFDDPMPSVVSLAAAQIRIPQPEHNGLLNYINLLLHFRELIRKHVVCPVSHESYLPGHLMPDYVDLGEKLEAAADKSRLLEIDELMEAAPEDVRAIWREDLAHASKGALVKETSIVVACERISSALAAVKNAPGRLSLYFPFRYDVRLLEQLGHAALLRSYGDRDNRAINELVDMKMPNLESLDPAEIVLIRSGNEFEQWRRTLKAALADAALQPADLYNRPAEIRRLIDEKLVEGKDQLETAISKSAVLAGLKKGAVSLLAGLTSAVVVHYLTNNNFLATVAGTSTSATVGGAAEAITAPKITDAQRALLAHYVAVLR